MTPTTEVAAVVAITAIRSVTRVWLVLVDGQSGDRSPGFSLWVTWSFSPIILGFNTRCLCYTP